MTNGTTTKHTPGLRLSAIQLYVLRAVSADHRALFGPAYARTRQALLRRGFIEVVESRYRVSATGRAAIAKATGSAT